MIKCRPRSNTRTTWLSNYSLTTYSPIEGWRMAFNGMNGRIEAWLDIPYIKSMQVDQSELHASRNGPDR